MRSAIRLKIKPLQDERLEFGSEELAFRLAKAWRGNVEQLPRSQKKENVSWLQETFEELED